jgi:hypothetical protein
MEDVQKNVQEQLMGMPRDAIEKVVSQLHMPPCPNTNPAVSFMYLHNIIDTFWNEFKAFQNCTHPYHEPSCWATYNATKGNSYLWHEKYSIPYTSVLGICGVPCYIKTLWDRSSREELGQSETSQGREKVSPEWQVN